MEGLIVKVLWKSPLIATVNNFVLTVRPQIILKSVSGLVGRSQHKFQNKQIAIYHDPGWSQDNGTVTGGVQYIWTHNWVHNTVREIGMSFDTEGGGEVRKFWHKQIH